MKASLLILSLMSSCGYVEHQEKEKILIRAEKWQVEKDLDICKQQLEFTRLANVTLASDFNAFIVKALDRAPELSEELSPPIEYIPIPFNASAE